MNPRIETHRTCRDCGETKPLTADFFRVRDDRPGWFRLMCRACSNVAARKAKALRKSMAEGGEVKELTKRCAACLTYKPATVEFFEPQKGQHPLNSRCRECRRGLRTEHRHPVMGAVATDPKHVPVKVCNECHNMSWRVIGWVCECGLKWAPEAKPELQLRRFDRERAV